MDETLKLIAGAATAIAALIGAAKFWAKLNQSNGRRWDIQSFEKIIEAKDKDLKHSDDECERLQMRINDLEKRLQVRRDNEHRLGNLLMERDAQIMELADQLRDCLGDLEGIRRPEPRPDLEA